MNSLGIFDAKSAKKKTHGRASVHGLGAVPTQYWPDTRVKAVQTGLNAALTSAGCSSTLKVDGLVGPGTCGALDWSKKLGSPPAAYLAASSDIDAGCAAVKTRTVPSCPAPQIAPAPLPPAPEPAPTPALAPSVTSAPTTSTTTRPIAPVIRERTKRAPAPSYVAVPASPADLVAPPPSGGMSLGMKIGIGAAAVALVGFAVFAKSKKKAA